MFQKQNITIPALCKYTSCRKWRGCSISDHTAGLVVTDRRSSVHRLPNMMGEKWQQWLWVSVLREAEWKWDASFTEPRDLIKGLCNKEAFFSPLTCQFTEHHACATTSFTNIYQQKTVFSRIYNHTRGLLLLRMVICSHYDPMVTFRPSRNLSAVPILETQWILFNCRPCSRGLCQRTGSEQTKPCQKNSGINMLYGIWYNLIIVSALPAAFSSRLMQQKRPGNICRALIT